MVTFLIIKGVKYVCNLKSETDYICFQLGPNMLAMSEIVPESGDSDFWTTLAKTNFRLLQLYVVHPYKGN